MFLEKILEDFEVKFNTKLQKKGKNYFSLCPFHNEKNPSFSIYQKNNVWYFYCFGCGQKGSLQYLVYNRKRKLSKQEIQEIQIMKLYNKHIIFLLRYIFVLEKLIHNLVIDEKSFQKYSFLLQEKAKSVTELEMLTSIKDKDSAIETFLSCSVPSNSSTKIKALLLTPVSQSCSTEDNIISFLSFYPEMLTSKTIKTIKEVLYEIS